MRLENLHKNTARRQTCARRTLGGAAVRGRSRGSPRSWRRLGYTSPCMNPLSKTGATIVILALASYTVAVLTEQRQRRLSPRVLRFLTAGVVLDVIATVFMILGSSKGAFTLHGLLGYSSLAAMMVDTVLVWRLAGSAGPDAAVPRGLHLYTRAAYLWWIAAFITGGLLVALR